MATKAMTFDPLNPDLKMVKQVLYQAFDSGTKTGAVDVWAEAWGFRDMEMSQWLPLQKFMVDKRLIYEAMPGHYSLTDKGQRFECGDIGPEDV